jgi:hypothetical protein
VGCFSVYVGSCLRTFRDSLLVPSPLVKQLKKAANRWKRCYVGDSVGGDCQETCKRQSEEGVH